MSKERIVKRKEELASKLLQVKIPRRQESKVCREIGEKLDITGVSVKNYLMGKIADGYVGEEILLAFEESGML